MVCCSWSSNILAPSAAALAAPLKKGMPEKADAAMSIMGLSAVKLTSAFDAATPILRNSFPAPDAAPPTVDTCLNVWPNTIADLLTWVNPKSTPDNFAASFA